MKLTIAFGLTFCTILASSLVVAESTGRIFHGRDANQGQLRYIVRLKCATFGEDFYKLDFRCGGSLIHEEWVLTAAHCVYDAVKVTVYLGGIYSSGNAQIAYVRSGRDITVHPQFNFETKKHDISLIKVPPTKSCDEVSIVPLPKVDPSSAPTYEGATGVTGGWGQLWTEGPLAERLQWTRIGVESNTACKRFFKGITPNNLCVSTISPFGSTCRGDSGGPLVLENTGELIGVASYISAKGCHLGTPVVFMRVTYYLPWIQATTGITL